MIIGIDEAGRGCWAGPLVATAVHLRSEVSGLMDSKTLSFSRRRELADTIRQNADVGIGWVSAQDVDELGLTAATSKAMHQALLQINGDHKEVIIDGNYNYLPGVAHTKTIIKADSLISSVSAASIIAKTARDAYMYNIARTFPEYDFDKHVGYGTKLHKEKLEKYGTCIEHRLSYKPIKAILRLRSV